VVVGAGVAGFGDLQRAAMHSDALAAPASVGSGPWSVVGVIGPLVIWPWLFVTGYWLLVLWEPARNLPVVPARSLYHCGGVARIWAKLRSAAQRYVRVA
jgi:hypothetical protein